MNEGLIFAERVRSGWSRGSVEENEDIGLNRWAVEGLAGEPGLDKEDSVAQLAEVGTWSLGGRHQVARQQANSCHLSLEHGGAWCGQRCDVCAGPADDEAEQISRLSLRSVRALDLRSYDIPLMPGPQGSVLRRPEFLRPVFPQLVCSALHRGAPCLPACLRVWRSLDRFPGRFALTSRPDQPDSLAASLF